jgi:hypothetical protein
MGEQIMNYNSLTKKQLIAMLRARERSGLPALDNNQLWRTESGEVVLVKGDSVVQFSWMTSERTVLACHSHDHAGDEGPEHALVEYLGDVEDILERGA